MRIQINNVHHDYAGAPVLVGVNATIAAGARIGIVGANGCGKSTLVRIITSQLEPTAGHVTCDGSPRIGVVPQSLEPGGARTVGEYLLAEILPLRARLRELEHEMGEEPDRLEAILRDYERARERYDAEAGDTAEERAERLIAELGLDTSLGQELRTLSGGEQNVLALARAVLPRPDLLVLDEPGNHLDFAGLAWLEEYLRRYPGAVLVVSHNRYLLDRVAESIWEIEGGALTVYSGNYSDYRFERLSRALADQALHAVEQRKLARLEELVRTFEERARVTGDPKWGKRLRARRTQLEKAREASIDAPSLGEQRIEVAFSRTDVRADIAVEIRGYRKAFGDRELFREASLLVHVGERVGIVGPNGSGKTTLLDELVRRGSWDDGVLRVGPSMRIGYCAQQRGRFAAGTSVLDAMLTAGSFTRKEVFAVLGRLRFDWDDLDRPVETLSGGEWNRLQLAVAIIARANLLVLDEPTNHLDIPSREAVEEALIEFEGTVITVSHDRYFLDAVARRIVEVADVTLVAHDGSFTEFWFRRAPAMLRDSAYGDLRRRRSATRGLSRRATAGNGEETDADARGQGRAGDGSVDARGGRGATIRAGDRAGASPSGGDPRATERRTLELEAEQQRLEAQMAEAFARGDYRGGRKTGNDLAQLRKRIEELYAQWGT